MIATRPGWTCFLDGIDAKARDAVPVVIAGERVRPEDAVVTSDVFDAHAEPPFRLISLPCLARMKLTANRDKDRRHIRDLIGVGLIDSFWLSRVPPERAARLRHILDTPEG